MDDTKSERLRELSRGAPPRVEQPPGFALRLRAHQIAAAEYAQSAPRMVIADPAGSGAQLSALAAVVDCGARPLLVACPRSLLDEWREQLGRSVPGWRATAFDRNRGEDILLGTSEVVLVAHTQLTSFAREVRRIRFRGLIFDQSHCLGNPAAQKTRAARHLVAAAGDGATVVESTVLACNTPASLASQLEILGLLERFPEIAAVRRCRSWDEVPEAVSLLEEMRGHCLLARPLEAILAMGQDDAG
jgi:hypothetical protein